MAVAYLELIVGIRRSSGGGTDDMGYLARAIRAACQHRESGHGLGLQIPPYDEGNQ